MHRIVGDEYFESSTTGLTPTRDLPEPPEKKVWTVGDDAVSKEELARIHTFLAQTTRPSWHASPPLNLGEPKHGKLKADVWRSAIEFDIPAAIAQLWMSGNRASSDGDDEAERWRRKLLLAKATIQFGEAVAWCTSYRTSAHHAMRYQIAMAAYLNTLKELYPTFIWRPNHHTALHIGPFLLLFGPMHGWWMFIFERVIGWLQKINTNFKRGEYCHASDVSTL